MDTLFSLPSLPLVAHRPVGAIDFIALKAISPALALLSTIAVLSLGILVILLPSVRALRIRAKADRCCSYHYYYEGAQKDSLATVSTSAASSDRQQRHSVEGGAPAINSTSPLFRFLLPSLYNRDVTTILRSVSFFIMMVTSQISIVAVAEGGVSPALLAAFAFTICSAFVFVIFFVFAGDLSMSFLVTIIWYSGSIWNVCFNTNPLIKNVHPTFYYMVVSLSFLCFVHASVWSFVVFRLWAVRDLRAGVLQLERLLNKPANAAFSSGGGGGQRRNGRHLNRPTTTGRGSGGGLLPSFIKLRLLSLASIDDSTELSSLVVVAGIAGAGLLLSTVWTGRV